MSTKLRNPFKLRASEKIESDAHFLKLFSPEILDLLIDLEKEGVLWNNVLFIRSSPGAGKTSLLRIFEPNSLTAIFNRRSQEYKELFQSLAKLNVITNDGIKLLGITIRCTRNYELLEDLKINENYSKRLFFSLLNSRIILATLRGLMNLAKANLKYPEDLDHLKFTYKNEENYLKNINTPCTGKELYDWASKIEKDVYETLDSFVPPKETKIEGHDELFSLSILNPEYFILDGKSVCSKILFTIDDAHKLSAKQRKSLFEYIVENRGHSNVWISERLEALTDFRSIRGRDYNCINLENFWSTNSGKFKKILSNIATKRASISTEEVNTFQEHLEEEFDETEFVGIFEESINTSLEKIYKAAAYSTRFENWLNYINSFIGTQYEKAILFKKIEIIIFRTIDKTQLVLDFPFSLQELLDKMDSSVEGAAKLFIAKEYKLPYYYGFQNLVNISSNNIDLFLSFASELFEGMLSNNVAGKEVQLNITRQEKIIKNVVEKKWKELQTLLPDSASIISFLNNLGSYYQSVTYKPTASYAPGINGFAINSKSSLKLFYEKTWEKDELFDPLRDTITTCLAFNLLESKTVKQGAANQEWEVFYFSRWLCIRFNLPLNYGNWNKITPEQLLKWLK